MSFSSKVGDFTDVSTNVIATFHEKTLFHFKLFLVALKRFFVVRHFLLGKQKSQGVPGGGIPGESLKAGSCIGGKM